MQALQEKATLAWDGEVTLGVLDEHLIRDLGLLDDTAALLHAIRTGKVRYIRRFRKCNKITNYARQYITSILAGTATMPLVLPSQMELGTGSGTPAATDTDLWTPAAATLKPLSNTQVYLTYYAQYVCTWQSSDPIQGSWTELGLKDANNNLWAHAAVSITVNPGEMLVGQWQVQLLGN